MELSHRVRAMKASATLAMAQKARELIASGQDVINMSLGEPDFGAPEYLKDAAIKAIEDDFSDYSPVGGFLDLRQAICEKFERDNQLSFKPSQVLVSTGAKQSIANLVLSLINPGDEVILPAPYWVSYKDIVKFAGGVPVEVSSNFESNYKVSADQISDAITDKTRLLLFSNPCNPSGGIYSEAELRKIGKALEGYSFHIASDEIYEYINFNGVHFSIGQIEELADRVITINGLSKGFAVTGWRLGYLAGPEKIIKACGKIQSQFTSGANSIVQKAAIEALKGGPEKVKYMCDAFSKRRDFIVNLVQELIPRAKVNVPEGAFYLFPDMSYYLENTRLKDSDELSQYLLEEALVAATPGAPFGCPVNLRLSYALGEKRIEEAIHRVSKALGKL